MSNLENVIEVKGLKNLLGEHLVHKDLDFNVNKGKIVAIAGGSGSGKTTLVRSILMLQKPLSGTIRVFNTDLLRCSAEDIQHIRRRWGVMFQHSALFSSLTVLENIMFPLSEFTQLNLKLQREIALLKIALVGLPINSATKYPAQLSGGMKKRVAVARAIALDPELIFLDEPSSGLDPKSIEALDELILRLRDSLGLTIVMITHDLSSMGRLVDEVAFLGEGRALAQESLDEIRQNPHPQIQDFFSGHFYNNNQS